MSDKRESLKSDEGYNSDKDEKLRQISQIEIESENKRIQQDAIIFKKRYFVQKLIHNSANGVIYKGESNWL